MVDKRGFTVDIDRVISIVQSCKDIVINNKNSDLSVVEKGNSDFVTRLDFEVQTYLRKKLMDIIPSCDFVSEEQSFNNYKSNERWILDPIDGTTNLVHDYQQLAISLAFVRENSIEFGIIYNPFNGETFWGIKGQGAYLNGGRIYSSNETTLKSSLIAIGTSPYNKSESYRLFETIHKVFYSSQDIRRSGSAAIDIAYVAAGRTEGFFEPQLKPWDYAAGIIILKEAGGIISNWLKSDLSLEHTDDVIATNKFIYDELIEIIQKKSLMRSWQYQQERIYSI
jgi:myo-inositol-1(or 4)-monophosphatase